MKHLRKFDEQNFDELCRVFASAGKNKLSWDYNVLAKVENLLELASYKFLVKERLACFSTCTGYISVIAGN